jgi:hypothetical protein
MGSVTADALEALPFLLPPAPRPPPRIENAGWQFTTLSKRDYRERQNQRDACPDIRHELAADAPVVCSGNGDRDQKGRQAKHDAILLESTRWGRRLSEQHLRVSPSSAPWTAEGAP